jgi:uncharacterized membrane protein YkvA (DUF1232 family)
MGIRKTIFNQVLGRSVGGRIGPAGRVQALLRLPVLLRLGYPLLRDPRVPLYLRASALGLVAFVLSPIDLPFDIPVLGQLWGVTMVVLILEWFIKLAPAHVVNEHIDALGLEKRVPKRPV